MDWSQPIAGVPPLVWALIAAILGPAGLLSRMAGNRFGAIGSVARWWTERTQRAIDRDIKRAKARQRLDNMAYAALERDIARLSSQMSAQARRHDEQIEDIRSKWRREREDTQVVIDELRSESHRAQRALSEFRDNQRSFQAWSEWVTRWAASVHNPPSPFMTLEEYRRRVWAG